MDPSLWSNYQHYSRLRAGGNHHQMNVHANVGLNVPPQSAQLNMNDHLSINSANQTMSGQYGGSAAAHSWFFSPHGLNASHQASNHHSDHASTFNPSPFLHHPGYDASSFLSGSFPSAAAKAGYIQTAGGFFNPMKKPEMSNDMSNLRGATFSTHCPPMNMQMAPPNMNNMTSDPNAGLATGNIFSSHLGPTSWRHHPNLMTPNAASGPFGILPHEAVNVMNSGGPSSSSSHAHASHHNNSIAVHNSSSHANKSENSKHQHHHHHHHKSSSSMAAAAASVMNNDNSYRNMIPQFPASQTGHSSSSRNQASFDHTASAKISHHHHSQADPYNSFAAAAAAAAAMNLNHAMTSEYASMQQTRYANMSSANQHAFGSNASSRTSYPTVGFPSDPTGRRELSSFLHNSKQNASNACSNRNMNVMNATSYLSNHMMMMNSAANSNYSPSPAHSANNAVSNSIQAVNSSTSRSSSAASNHPLQQANDNSSSCSYGYGSPATNLPQSPYQQQQPQRSNTSNSSQGTPSASSAVTNVQTTQDFTSYGTPQVYPSMSTPAPTPTPGYPTPPSSVGQTHVVSQPNSQATASAHDESVAHYPQLTPQTPSSQSTPFGTTYNSTYQTTPKMQTNSTRTSPAAIMPNTSSSCMVAAAAANMNVSGAASVSQRTSSGYLMSGSNLHESDAESVCMSNMVNVNPLNNIPDANKLSDAQMASSAEVNVMGHQSEPTLNSVFASQDIDFPSISFPPNDDNTNSFGNNVKMDQNGSYHKKKSKSGKKSKKKDKTKGVAISMDPAPPYSGYHYPQYQNSYPLTSNDHSNSYMMQQQSIAHSQSSQSHNMMPQNSSAENTSSAAACYDMQYQHLASHQHEPLQQHQNDPLQSMHHDSLQQSVQQQPQPHEIMESVMAIQTQHQTQEQTNQSISQTSSVNDKQSFPTIDDELSFLTEPTPECVSMETQTPTIQVETQTPTDVTSNGSAPVNDNMVITTAANSNQNTASTQATATPAAFLKSFMSFISDASSRLSPSLPSTTKEKKRKKHKDNFEGKVFNGQKSNKNKRLKSGGGPSDDDSAKEDNAVKSNHLILSQNQNKCGSYENTAMKKTGEKDYGESKFFKRRPSSNINMSVQLIEGDNNNKTVCKTSKRQRKQNKNNNDMFLNVKQTPHDEYEFPDSPLSNNKPTAKKQRKSSNSESTKKKQISTFEKLATASINVNFKKTPSQKKAVPIPALLSNNNTNNTKPIVVAKNCDNDNTKEGCAIATKQLSNSNLKTIQKPQLSAQLKQHSELQRQQQQQQSQAHDHAQQLQSKEALREQPQQTQLLQQSQTQKKQTQSQNKKNLLTTKQSASQSSTTAATTSTSLLTYNNTAVTTMASSTAQHSVGMQSAGTNTPRRRSQDKKASTIREGLMRTGDFVVSIDESQYELPVIWRIEGKSLLQRFEPSDQDGVTVYINTSSYSAWNPTVRQRYTGVDVRVMGCSRTRIVVEKLGLSQNNPNVNGSATIERVSGYNKSSSSSSSSTTFHHQENFEVFIQTLISQALDPNFISEIVKENDEYFLSHVQAIDDVCSRKKSRFFSKIKWDANIVKCVETYPLFTITPQDNIGDLRCRLCNDNWSTQILQFNGDPYHPMTLEPQSAIDMKQTKYAACDLCKDKIVLYSHLHHQKYHFYQKCNTKVENMRGGDENKESHVILEQCLQDTEWINTLFKELEEIWLSCDKIR